ncbi:MAG: undecaprenyl/decaprenyl-phosphate alpha-N-acetylglucosaminyl 1-phosphate transferase, partial [Kangiellaceae bacterium]|nr:undecaprenyl/decaprenyl-phosphate alpha-N-acetylglucosaminyl 1-phosphate transferase [Kangiellaceae bacterium]
MGDLSPLLHNLVSPQLFLALVISLALIPLLRRIAVRIDLVDHPGGRKQHKTSVPLAGGAAIFLSLLISSYTWGLPHGFEGFSIAVCGLFLIGFLDDKYDISAKFRLILQTALVVFALWLDNNWLSQITFTDNFILQLNEFKYPFTTILILGLINAINMLDGLDGLSSGIVLIILGFLIGISSIAGTSDISLVAICIFGAVLGFWAFNYRFSWREKASIFMGDSGTIVLGFALPYLAIKLTLFAPTFAPESMMLWLFALPVWDICAVVLKRMRDGKSPLQAGRDHIHHVLMGAGLTVRHTLHLIYLL